MNYYYFSYHIGRSVGRTGVFSCHHAPETREIPVQFFAPSARAMSMLRASQAGETAPRTQERMWVNVTQRPLPRAYVGLTLNCNKATPIFLRKHCHTFCRTNSSVTLTLLYIIPYTLMYILSFSNYSIATKEIFLRIFVFIIRIYYYCIYYLFKNISTFWKLTNCPKRKERNAKGIRNLV